MTTTRDVLQFLGLTKARGPLPHWGLYATIAVCEVVVLAAGAALGAPAWLPVLLGLLAVLMAALAVVSYRQRRRSRQDGDRPDDSRTTR